MGNTVQLSDLKGDARITALAKMKPGQRVAALLQERRADIAKMLPSTLTADRLLKVATIATTTTPALLECEIPSLITAVGQCALFGLEPNTILGHAYMIPFNKNENRDGTWHKRKLVQVVIGYKGLIDLARRSGQIVSISAHEVCQADNFEYCYGLEEKLVHVPADGDRGPITHFYAYAKLKDGGTAFEVMSRTHVDQIRDAAALKNGAKRDNNGHVPIKGPWLEHYAEMGRKTVIRRLAKYLPLSVEFQKAAALDEASDKGLAIGAIEGDFIVEADDDGPNGPAGGPEDQGAPSGQDSQATDVGAAAPSDQQSNKPDGGAPTITLAQLTPRLEGATDPDLLDADADLIQHIENREDREKASAIYHRKRAELCGEPPEQRQPRTRRTAPTTAVE